MRCMQAHCRAPSKLLPPWPTVVVARAVRFRPTTGCRSPRRISSYLAGVGPVEVRLLVTGALGPPGLLYISLRKVRITNPQGEAATQLTWLAYSDEGRPVRPVAIAR